MLPQDPPDDVEFEEWHALYLNAWDALRHERPYGAMGGEGPIMYSAIRMYAADNGIEGTDLVIFRQIMSALDGEWLKFRGEQAKAREATK